MSMEVGNDMRVRWKLMNRIRNKPGCVWIPVGREAFGIQNLTQRHHDLPERDRAVRFVARGEEVDRVQIATKIDQKSTE